MVMFRKKNRTTSRKVIASPMIWMNLDRKYISPPNRHNGVKDCPQVSGQELHQDVLHNRPVGLPVRDVEAPIRERIFPELHGSPAEASRFPGESVSKKHAPGHNPESPPLLSSLPIGMSHLGCNPHWILDSPPPTEVAHIGMARLIGISVAIPAR